MKRLLFALALGAATNIQAAMCDYHEFNINGLSKHFSTSTIYSRTYGYNELNSGLGVTCGVNHLASWKSSFEVGFLRNSFRQTSTYLAYNLQYPLSENIDAGVKLIIANGYDRVRKSYDGVVAGPMLTTKWHLNSDVAMNFSVAPPINGIGNDGFLFMNIGIKF